MASYTTPRQRIGIPINSRPFRDGTPSPTQQVEEEAPWPEIGPDYGQHLYTTPVEYPVEEEEGGNSYTPHINYQGTAVLNPYSPGSSHISTPSTPSGQPVVDPITGITAPQAEMQQAEAVDEANLSGIPIGETGYHTREVQDNELVEEHLSSLLSGNSRYLNNARQRAAELSNRRGQFTSNMFAGAAERSAIEAAMPIATADAQAYRDAATQNLTAKNQNAIANIQRAAQLDSSLLSSRTSIALGNLDAATRIGIANMDTLAQIDIANLDSQTKRNIASMNNSTQLLLQTMQGELELTMQGRNIQHERSIEQFRQQGRLDLANLDASLQKELQARGFQNSIDLQNLSGKQQMEINTLINEYDLEKQNREYGFATRQSHINMAMQAQVNYINYLASFAGTDMDENAANRLQQQADNQLLATFAMINGLYPDQPAIEVEFGNIGG